MINFDIVIIYWKEKTNEKSKQLNKDIEISTLKLAMYNKLIPDPTYETMQAELSSWWPITRREKRVTSTMCCNRPCRCSSRKPCPCRTVCWGRCCDPACKSCAFEPLAASPCVVRYDAVSWGILWWWRHSLKCKWDSRNVESDAWDEF